MPRPLIKEHNIETNEVIEREMNDDEFAVYEQRLARLDAEKQEIENKKTAAEAKLVALGLTVDDLKVLQLG